MYQKTEAIVLKTIDFSETSLVLTLFSRDFGKIRALAKGGRRIKGPFESALDLMSHLLITYIPKRGDTLDLLTESKLIRRFRPNRQNFSGLYAGYYVIELLNEMTIEQQPAPELFDLATETLCHLENGQPVMPTLMRFEWLTLEWTGHFPSLDVCVGCGCEMEMSQKRIAFGHIDGGVLCPACRPGATQVSFVSPETLQAAVRLAMSDENEIPPLDQSTRGEMRALLNQYISHLIGKRPAMYKYLK